MMLDCIGHHPYSSWGHSMYQRTSCTRCSLKGNNLNIAQQPSNVLLIREQRQIEHNWLHKMQKIQRASVEEWAMYMQNSRFTASLKFKSGQMRCIQSCTSDHTSWQHSCKHIASISWWIFFSLFVSCAIWFICSCSLSNRKLLGC